jgi:hypothetical protein
MKRKRNWRLEDHENEKRLASSKGIRQERKKELKKERKGKRVISEL